MGACASNNSKICCSESTNDTDGCFITLVHGCKSNVVCVRAAVDNFFPVHLYVFYF